MANMAGTEIQIEEMISDHAESDISNRYNPNYLFLLSPCRRKPVREANKNNYGKTTFLRYRTRNRMTKGVSISGNGR